MTDTPVKNKDLSLAKEKWQDFQKTISSKMVAQIKTLEEVRKRHQGQKIVFTVGAWDLLNEGHGRYLYEAKKEGDILVVGVATDKSRRKIKGEGHPVVGEKVRAETLAYLASVDYTVIVDEDDLIPVLQVLKPDVFYTLQADWDKGNRDPGEEYVVQSCGGKIKKKEMIEPYVSSSEMIDKIASIKIRQIVFSSLGKKMGNLILSKNGYGSKT